MYYNLKEEELRTICRNCIESMELWARRLIHDKMVESYGNNYVDYKNNNGEYIIKKEIREHIHKMISKSDKRFKRYVDTLFLNNLIYFLCNPKFYSNLFKEALDKMYPNGKDEVRTYLNRLINIRNSLSHANPISIREAEQAVCYSNDFIEGIKKYYEEKGMEKIWNVPRIIRVTDSLGNVFDDISEGYEENFFMANHNFRCGDTYRITVEVDSSFSRDEYEIRWNFGKKEYINKDTLVLKFDERDVSDYASVNCRVISNKNWHKFKYYDSEFYISFSVLPPI